MWRRIYLSPAARVISVFMRLLAPFAPPMMLYGYVDRVTGRFRKRTRVSWSAALSHKRRISVANGVWIGHFCVVDGSCGVTIGEGVQLAAGAQVYSHGSHHAIRLHGERYIEVHHADRIGYRRGPVTIGDYTFVGSAAILLPGTRLGRGCLVGAGTVVAGDWEPFSIIGGNPAKKIGDVRAIDANYADQLGTHYFDREALAEWRVASSLPEVAD